MDITDLQKIIDEARAAQSLRDEVTRLLQKIIDEARAAQSLRDEVTRLTAQVAEQRKELKALRAASVPPELTTKRAGDVRAAVDLLTRAVSKLGPWRTSLDPAAAKPTQIGADNVLTFLHEYGGATLTEIATYHSVALDSVAPVINDLVVQGAIVFVDGKFEAVAQKPRLEVVPDTPPLPAEGTIQRKIFDALDTKVTKIGAVVLRSGLTRAQVINNANHLIKRGLAVRDDDGLRRVA